jgi:hypothetical protein
VGSTWGSSSRSRIMDSRLLWLPAIVLGIFALSLIPAFIAALAEKYLVWTYVPIRGAKPPPSGRDADLARLDELSGPDVSIPITDYFRATNLTAERSGFTLLGAFRDGRGKLYRTRYNFWLSPDRLVLAVVGTGALAGIPLTGTWLYTRLRDGHGLVTLDELKGWDSDLSGLTLQEVVTNADFAELLARHRQRLADADQPAEPYSADDPLADHRAFRSFRTDRLEERGLVRYRDAERNAWKYTFKGAFVAVARMAARQVGQVFRNRGRTTISRPGQSGYIPSERRSSRWVGVLDKAQFFFWIMLGVGAVLAFSRGPAGNRAQAAFRAAVLGIGLGGIAVVWILKRSIVSSARESGQPRSAEGVGAGAREEHRIETATWGEDDSPERI